MSWFASDERLNMLRATAAKWLGTPFHPHGKLLGHGVSCETLPLLLYQECGFLPPDFSIPTAPIDWGRSHRESVMETFLNTSAAFEGIPPGLLTLCGGDLLGFRIGRVVHHLGVVVRVPEFIHCTFPEGVTMNLVTDASWQKRLVKVWRPRDA